MRHMCLKVLGTFGRVKTLTSQSVLEYASGPTVSEGERQASHRRMDDGDKPGLTEKERPNSMGCSSHWKEREQETNYPAKPPEGASPVDIVQASGI